MLQNGMRPGRIAIAGIVVAIMVAGCSSKTSTKSASGDDQAPTESSSISSSASSSPSMNRVDAPQYIHAYFGAMASTNPDRLRKVVRNTTVPGSLAAAYGIHQAGGTDADIDGGSQVNQETVKTFRDGDMQLCKPSANKDGSDACYRYGDFKVNRQGRLASFTINKRPLKGRIILGSGVPHRTPLGSVTLVSAYVTQAGYLSVVTKVHTHAMKVIYGQNGTTYRDRSGRQRTSSNFSGPGEILPNSRATVNLIFQGPIRLGGDLTIDLTRDGVDYSSSFVHIKTHA